MIPISLTFLVATVVVGTVMGLLGGGGSILLVPLLTYVGGLEPKQAIASSLIVVVSSAALSTALYFRKGLVRWREGLTLACFAMLASYGGGRAAAYVPSTVLMLIFATLMTTSAVLMLTRKSKVDEEEDKEVIGSDTGSKMVETGKEKPKIKILKTGAIGMGIGFITGLIGAGGGFMIVPVLVLVMGVGMREAVSTSLFVMSLNGLAAITGHLTTIDVDWSVILWVMGAMMTGSVLGTLGSSKVKAKTLKKAFAVMVLVIAASIYWREMPGLWQ